MFDVRVRISSMSEEHAFRTLRKIVENAHNEFSYANDRNGHSQLLRVDRDGEEVLGFEYDNYGNEIDE